jgi:glycosyltransferase involved in cell wall biosynthesis
METVSLIIPCIDAHFQYLSNLMDQIISGVVIPHEIVIVVNNHELIEHQDIVNIQRTYDSKLKSLKIIGISNRITPGRARQIGVDNSTGSIIIFQDADDFIHPQRIQIIMHMFKKYDIVHLNHGCIKILRARKDCPFYKLDDIKYHGPDFTYNHMIKHSREPYYLRKIPFKIVCGVPAVRRHVFDEVKWLDQNGCEDSMFCRKVCETFKKSAIIDTPLITYNYYRSSSKL